MVTDTIQIYLIIMATFVYYHFELDYDIKHCMSCIVNPIFMAMELIKVDVL